MSVIVFIYLRSRRKDFAINRALGLPKKTTIKKLLIPIFILGIAGILIGGAASWSFALNQATQTLSQINVDDGIELSVNLAVYWLPIFCAMVLALLTLLTFVSSRFILRQPVLELLQGGTNVKSKSK
jgi:ABC-type antimicrobial peptide transport system permease subunit